MQKSTYGFPGQGLLATTVVRNSKCDGCLHFGVEKGIAGVCTIGDQPSTCGDGFRPERGYAPLVLGGGPNIPGGPLAYLVQPLGEAYFPVVKSIYDDLAKAASFGCALHGSRGFGVEKVCTCGEIYRSSIVAQLWDRLPNRTRVAVESREALAEFVGKALNSYGIGKPKKVSTKKAPFVPKNETAAKSGTGIPCLFDEALSKALDDVMHYAKQMRNVDEPKKALAARKKIRGAAFDHLSETAEHLTSSEHAARAQFHHEMAAEHMKGAKAGGEHYGAHQEHYAMHRALEHAHKTMAADKDAGVEKGLGELEKLVS